MGRPLEFSARFHRLVRHRDLGGALRLPRLSIGRPVCSQNREPLIPASCLRVCVPDVLGWCNVLSDGRTAARKVVCVLIACFGERSGSACRNVSISGVPFALEDDDAPTNVF